MRFALLAVTVAVAPALALAQAAHASFVLYANPTSWANHAGGTPVQADLFDYLGFPFATQQVPDNIFADLGVTMHSTVPLIAHMQTTGGSWYISTDTQGTQIEILFATPQTAVYLSSGALTPQGASIFGGSTRNYYSGSTLLGSTSVNEMGVISSIPIDRIVVAVNSPSYSPLITPLFYFVPSPAALGFLLIAPLTARTRRRI